MSWLLLLSAASATGMAAPAQFAINTQLLDDVVVSPVLTVALSCLVGTVALFASTAILRCSVPELGPITSAPWWMWLGLLGAFFVCASIILTPTSVRAATTVGVLLIVQVVASIAINQLGLLGVPVQSASLPRVGGAPDRRRGRHGAAVLSPWRACASSLAPAGPATAPPTNGRPR